MPKYRVNVPFYGLKEDAGYSKGQEVELEERRAADINEKLKSYANDKDEVEILTLVETEAEAETEVETKKSKKKGE